MLVAYGNTYYLRTTAIIKIQQTAKLHRLAQAPVRAQLTFADSGYDKARVLCCRIHCRVSHAIESSQIASS